MGNPVKIYDLAVKMIDLYGKTLKDKNNPLGEIEIIKIGLQKGEKLFEELLIEQKSKKTEHKRIFKAYESFLEQNSLLKELNKLKIIINNNNDKKTRDFLDKLIYKN